MSSPFGTRQLNGRSDLHTGVDVAASEGTPVFAMLDGLVVLAAPSGQVSGYGNVLVLQHGPSLFSLYAHLSAMFVRPGDVVAAGAPIGLVGRTAGTPAEPSKLFDASGAHLHFEFLSQWPPHGKDLDRIDPGPLLAQLGIIVPSTGPLVLACSSSPAPATPATSDNVWVTLEPQARPRATTAAASLAPLALLALWAFKQKRRTV